MLFEIQHHILETATNAQYTVSLAKEQILNPFYFSRQEDNNIRKRSADFTVFDKSQKKRSLSKVVVIPSKNYLERPSNKKFVSFLEKHPLSSSDKMLTIQSDVYKNKLVDDNGIPITFHCFKCGAVDHGMNRCPQKSVKTYAAASPLVKSYYNSKKN